MFLVGDIGGTNARFAIARTAGKEGIVLSDFEKFTASQFDSFDDTMNQFVEKIGHRPSLAVLAVAGPIHDGEVKFTNRKWHLRASEIKQNCQINEVCLMNDFTAMAFSVTRVSDDSFISLKAGTPEEDGPILVAGPGTGFGSCLLIGKGQKRFAIPCEGGHSLFTPRTPLQHDINAVLQRSHPNVSVERICGGANLDDLVVAMADVHGITAPTLSPQEIIEKALDGDAFCHDLCQLRADAIVAGLANLALIGGARGGVVVSGGVARHLANFLSDPQTIEGFASIWPQGNYLQNIPVKLLVNPLAPLIGAAAHYLHNEG